MSFNRLNVEDSTRISELLKENHTLYGFHF